MTIGEKIQELMDWAGLQQKELAKLSGVSPSIVSDYVRDEREPTLPALRKLAHALNVSPWVIISGDPLPVTPLDITEEEGRMLARYRAMTESERSAVNAVIQAFSERKQKK